MLERIREILLYYTEGEITEDAQLRSDLGLSSFELVEVISSFEDEFGIEIPDRELWKFVSVRDILDYLALHASC